MAWTPGRWPLVACDPVDTRYANELRTELNARHGSGVIADAFTDGERTWSVVEELRNAIESVLDDFFKEDDWASYVGCGVAGSGSGIGETVNIFLDVFGGARDAWLNTPPATQATGPDYEPTNCDDPWKSYLNELYSIIDALQWRRVQASLYEDGNSKHRLQKYDGWASQNFVGREGALQDTLDHANALAATAFDTEPSIVWFDYKWNEGIPEWQAKVMLARTFFFFALPDGVHECKAYLVGLLDNWYEKLVGGACVKTVNPAWSSALYIGNASPGILTDADWAFGVLGATIPAESAIGPTINASSVVDLANYTQDATNYLQLRLDETLPEHVVDFGFWDGGWQRMETEFPNAAAYVFFKVVA